MTVLDLQKVIFDIVCLYTATENFDFVDLFKGNPADIPAELLCKRVTGVYSARKHMLDIRIEM